MKIRGILVKDPNQIAKGYQLMAMYEYSCKACDKQFEVQQKISEKPLKECPQCGKEEGFSKLISLSSFSLKGGGWFKDGYVKPKPE